MVHQANLQSFNYGPQFGLVTDKANLNAKVAQ